MAGVGAATNKLLRPRTVLFASTSVNVKAGLHAVKSLPTCFPGVPSVDPMLAGTRSSSDITFTLKSATTHSVHPHNHQHRH